MHSYLYEIGVFYLIKLRNQNILLTFKNRIYAKRKEEKKTQNGDSQEKKEIEKKSSQKEEIRLFQ